MEELVIDDPGLGLNIICQDPIISNHGLKEKKTKKKFNKYEKRRYKAKLAKEGLHSNQSKESLLLPPNESSDKKESIEENSKLNNETNNNLNSFNETKVDQVDDDDDIKTIDTNLNDEQDVNRKSSRRYHKKDELDEEEKRAAYMAEFHAHPMEMDRRSKAESKIKLSTSSSHIFMTKSKNDINNDKINPNKNNSSPTETNTKCPFINLGLNKRLANTITSQKGPFRLNQPTIIQSKALSLLLPSMTSSNNTNKSNIFIQSETGSGKTLAYLLPIIQSLIISSSYHKESNSKDQRHHQSFRTLILLPTRELAIQTYQTALQLTLHTQFNITPVCLSGGEKRKSEKARLRKGFSILIGTPGRILDHLQKTECLRTALSSPNSSIQNQTNNAKFAFEWLILDEADRLLDMGLGGQIKKIMTIIQELCSKSWNIRGYNIRTILVSATITEEMKILTKDLLQNVTQKMNDPSWIWVSAETKETIQPSNPSFTQEKYTKDDVENTNTLPLLHAAPRQLAQQHIIVSAKLRLPALIAFLMARVKQNQRVVVFMSTCDIVDYHYKLVTAMDNILLTGNDKDDTKGIFGTSCDFFRLHGNIQHAERNQIVQKFTKETFHTEKSSKLPKSNILFATDVAARGLNLPGVDWIVQYDPPCEISDYIHRAGRTARAGKAGNALLFLLPSEKSYIEVLDIKGLKGVNTALSLSSTLQHAAEICPYLTKEGERKSGGGSRIGEAFAMALQIKLEECVVDDTMSRKQTMKKLKKDQKNKGKRREGKRSMAAIKEQEDNLLENGLQALARNAFVSFLRAYPTKEKAVRHIFSTRALHLGHIARSFALKDPPKALRMSKKQKTDGTDHQQGNELDNHKKKRNANLAFEENSKNDYEKSKKRQPKRSKTAKLKGKFTDGKMNVENSTSETRKAKMLSAAKKLQSGGMEFF